MTRHSSPNRRAALPALVSAQPVSMVLKSDGVRDMPVSASRIASGRPCSRTRPSRGSSSVASPARATKMNTGWPKGAGASRRADSGVDNPAKRRARSRRPATEPRIATSALIVDTVRQARVACVTTSVPSDAGPAGPLGSFINGAPHEVARSAAASAATVRVISWEASASPLESSCRCRSDQSRRRRPTARGSRRQSPRRTCQA